MSSCHVDTLAARYVVSYCQQTAHSSPCSLGLLPCKGRPTCVTVMAAVTSWSATQGTSWPPQLKLACSRSLKDSYICMAGAPLEQSTVAASRELMGFDPPSKAPTASPSSSPALPLINFPQGALTPAPTPRINFHLLLPTPSPFHIQRGSSAPGAGSTGGAAGSGVTLLRARS
jgi:hypothetical protein